MSGDVDARWRRTLDRVARAVVTVRVDLVRGFDGENRSSSQATGFVVDAARGLVLTNRHVVEAGPVVAQGVFLDHEEVALVPVYRDPVHDFGFFRYDPAALRSMVPLSLPLAPEAARVGVEIRVVGNDSGEKLSILAGTLARLDREAPRYQADRWSDFNTFYLQAASSTSGGSSGSPVVDIEGRVVALNAGARTQTATGFYLPLDRVVPALVELQGGRVPARGTVDAVLGFTPYGELRRLGLSAEDEDHERSLADAHGRLVVREVVPGGPADGGLHLGDVLLSLDGGPVVDFVGFEAHLDDRVGREVRFEVLRGGRRYAVDLTVADQHAGLPARLIEVGGAVLHDVSIHQARIRSVPRHGVFVAQRGALFDRAGIPTRAVLSHLGGVAIGSIDDAWSALGSLPHGAEVAVRYAEAQQPQVERMSFLRMDRRWYPMNRWVRDDAVGRWRIETGPPAPPAPARRRVALEPEPGAGPRSVARALVEVTFHAPYRVEGVHGTAFSGVGVVIDAERGLVVTDRECAPVALGEVLVTFGGAQHVPAEVVLVHPTHHLAVVRYDPAAVDGSVASARAGPGAEGLASGHKLWRVVLEDGEIHVLPVTWYRLEPLVLPLPDPPRARSSTLSTATLGDGDGTGPGGVLVDDDGAVVALWASFSAQEGRDLRDVWGGIPFRWLRDAADRVVRGDRTLPILGAELTSISIADARVLGLPDGWTSGQGGRRRVLAVARVHPDSGAGAALRPGDVVLAVGGTPVFEPASIDAALGLEALPLTVLRDREVRRVDVPPMRVPSRGVDRVVSWAGALIHLPHPEVGLQRGRRSCGVYVCWTAAGSPASRYDLVPTLQIVAVDGSPTPDLDRFRVAVAAVRGSARLDVVDLVGRRRVSTLVPEEDYWPTTELRYTAEGWIRIGS